MITDSSSSSSSIGGGGGTNMALVSRHITSAQHTQEDKSEAASAVVGYNDVCYVYVGGSSTSTLGGSGGQRSPKGAGHR